MTPWQRLEADMRACYKCPLSRTRHTVVVGRGNCKAPIMLIGEGPGEREDRTGQPFTGPSGTELTEYLHAAHLNEDTDVYICNVIKCRPPGNQFPAAGIVTRCLPWLEQQIAHVGPRVVIPMGAHACAGTLYQERANVPPMEDLAGRWIWTERLPLLDFLPMFHPAYALRARGSERKRLTRQAVETFDWARTIVKGNEPPATLMVLGNKARIVAVRQQAGIWCRDSKES